MYDPTNIITNGQIKLKQVKYDKLVESEGPIEPNKLFESEVTIESNTDKYKHVKLDIPIKLDPVESNRVNSNWVKSIKNTENGVHNVDNKYKTGVRWVTPN